MLGVRWETARSCKKLIVLSFIQLVVAVAIFQIFFYSATWLVAEPRDSARHKFDGSIPEEWKNVVIGGGKVTEWRRGTVGEEPEAFAAISALLGGCVLFLWVSVWYASRLKRSNAVKSGQQETPEETPANSA